MAESSTSQAPAEIPIMVRAPGDKKLNLTVDTSKTVLELKEQIAALDVFKEDPCEPATQRLIFSGRVLKDADPLTNYKIASGNTIHLVRSAKKPDPPPPAAQVPESFSAGHQYANNPLAPLMAGQGPALAGFNPFADAGNPSDPNFLQNMMNSPGVQQQIQSTLSDPAMIDQIISSSPELQRMGPQARAIMQSPMFRQMISNPDMMRQMMEMQRGMGPGGSGGGPQPGLFGLAQQQAQQGGAAAAAAAPSTTAPGSSAAPAATAGQNPMAGLESLFGGAGAGAGAQNPLAGLFGAGSPFGAGAGAGGFGGFNPPAPQPADTRPPEERFEVQLGQLREMGMHNTAQNVRALQATGGNVEAAIEYIFSGGGL